MSLLDKSIELYMGIKAAKPMNDPMYLQIRDFIVNHFGHEGTRALAVADEQPIVFTYKSNTTSTGRQMRAFEHPLNANKRASNQPDAEPQTNIEDDGTMALSALQNDYASLGETIAATKHDDPKMAGYITAAYRLRLRLNAVGGMTVAPTNYKHKETASKSKQSETPGNVTKSPELAAKAAKDAEKNAGKRVSPAPSPTKTLPVAAAGDVTPGGIEQPTTTATDPVDVDVEIARTMKAKALGELYPAETLKRYLTTNTVETTGKESRTQLAALVLLHIKDKPE